MFSIPVCCVVAALYGPRVIDFVLSDISGSIPVDFCVLDACSVSTTIGLYLLLLLAKLTNSPLWGSIHGMNQSNVFYSVHFDVKTIYFYFSLADPGVDEVEGRMVEDRGGGGEDRGGGEDNGASGRNLTALCCSGDQAC